MRQPLISAIRSISIFKRLLISFMIVIIAPGLIIGLFTYSVVSKQMEQNIGMYADQYIANLSNGITQQLRQYDDISHNIYLDEGMLSLLRQAKLLNRISPLKGEASQQYADVKTQIEARLYHWTDTLPYTIGGIEIVTDYDEFTQTDGALLKGSRMSDRVGLMNSPMYKRAMEHRDEPFWYVSRDNYTFFRVQGKNSTLNSTMSHFRVIRDPDDRGILGLIIVHIPLLSMIDLYKGEETIDKGNLLLFGNDGKAEMSFNAKVQGPYPTDALGRELVDRREGVLSRNLDGRETLITFQTSPYTGWTIASLIPEKSLYAGVYKIRDLIIRVSAIFIGLAFVVSYLVTVSITRPLIHLKKSMERVIGGELNVRYYDPLKDEIGLLGRIFNRMIGRLQQLIDTIYQVEADKQSEMMRRKEAELSELQMQMNPHFLYNTLDIIRWQAMFQEQGEGKVSRMLGSFSNLMKMSLIRTNKLVTLEEELEHIRAYWKVLEFHYHGRLDMELDIAPDVPACRIVKFALQPIIENAVIHGLKGRKEPMTIRIEARRSEGEAEIVISNNGAGIGEERAAELNEAFRSPRDQGKHIGIQNVNERIRLRFGEDYGLQFRCLVPEGTAVVIRIPFATEE